MPKFLKVVEKFGATLGVFKMQRLGYVSFIFFACLGLARADEVKIGMPEQKDAFIVSLLNSKDLKAAGILLVETRFRSENDVLDATIKGNVQVGLFPLIALDRRPIEGLQRIYSVFTRPFLFKSGDEIFATEDTALGDAALADIRAANIFPLKFWNRGFSKIVARNPMRARRDFERLRVVVDADSRDAGFVGPALTSMGAETTQLMGGHSISSAISTGLAEATVVDPWSSYENSDWKQLAAVSGPLFSIDFEPIIGVLAASNDYWNRLSEREKQAWKRAVNEATNASQRDINEGEMVAKSFSNVRPMVIKERDRYRLIFSYAAGKPEVAEDIRVLEKARNKLELSETQKKKK